MPFLEYQAHFIHVSPDAHLINIVLLCQVASFVFLRTLEFDHESVCQSGGKKHKITETQFENCEAT